MALGPGLKSYPVALDAELVEALDGLRREHRLRRSLVIRAALRAGLPRLGRMTRERIKDMGAVQLPLPGDEGQSA